ncbi:MAG: hypothetical protein IJM26_05670 [Lachnospiraceae bacterium]|nr:hypothetical protein [Lachnospiraceae bacterium]
MTIREKYEEFLARRDEVAADTLGKYFLHQVGRYVHPFRICGNVWYLGDTWVCVHLIDTGEGLLLIDSGNCGAEAMLAPTAINQQRFYLEQVGERTVQAKALLGPCSRTDLGIVKYHFEVGAGKESFEWAKT